MKASIAIVSFSIALLPFFDPISNDVGQYDKTIFSSAPIDTEHYLEVISKDRVFQALAWYTIAVGMAFRSEALATGLQTMAKSFVTDGYAASGTEISLRGIHTAIANWRPEVKGKRITKEKAEKMATNVVNMLVVEYAREDEKFEVGHPEIPGRLCIGTPLRKVWRYRNPSYQLLSLTTLPSSFYGHFRRRLAHPRQRHCFRRYT